MRVLPDFLASLGAQIVQHAMLIHIVLIDKLALRNPRSLNDVGLEEVLGVAPHIFVLKIGLRRDDFLPALRAQALSVVPIQVADQIVTTASIDGILRDSFCVIDNRLVVAMELAAPVW